MGTDACVIRNYCPDDLEQYIRLHAETESVCRSDDALLLGSLRDGASEPIGFSEENLFLGEVQGKIVGACRVVPELAIDRVVLRLLIRPGFINREAAGALIDAALKRAHNLKVSKAHVDLRENDKAACELFAGLGFQPIRRYADMKLDVEAAAIAEPKHESLTLRSLEPGEEDNFTELQNCSFGDSWGFCRNTPDEIIQTLNASAFGHDGVIIAFEEEKAAGYCWTVDARQTDQSTAPVTGRIHMLGVAPEFRGRGVGRLVLWAGLKYLANKAIKTVELTMDRENEASCSLYDGAGFKPHAELLWYEKILR